jgi:mannosyltransferase OCH1-like enzyme
MKLIRLGIIFLFFPFCLVADASLCSKIPPTIWQTYKTKALSVSEIENRNTWIRLNPEFFCFLYDDSDIESYIQCNWPFDFLDFFHALPIGAMKADLWRYLILASEGGVYSDMDSVCLSSIREWPLKGRTSGPNVLLIDLDVDQDQFCQWTFAASPKHPAMQYICRYVLNQWKQRGFIPNQNGTINVLATTGPIVFSRAIKSYIGEPVNMAASQILKRYIKDKDYRKRINRLGIFFTSKGFFSGKGAKNLFWGSWSEQNR